MAQLIRKVLDKPIRKGFIDWLKIEEAIHAALNTVDNKFDKVRDPKTGEDIQMCIEDALTFHVRAYDRSYTYKLYKPRFNNGELYCSGFEMGHGKIPNVLWVPASKVEF